MNSFSRNNLRNIKAVFEEKTGVELPAQADGRRAKSVMIMAAAVVLVFSVTLTAYADSLFSSLSGDELGLSASYEGEGVVSIQVENWSDKELSFQHQLRLMRWSDGMEIQPAADGDVVFSGSKIEPHSGGVMTVDLSGAYDIDLLEQPLTDDHYYLVLTNNNFVFGQDWMCSVYFAEPVISVEENPDPLSPAEADQQLTAQIAEELQPFFESYTADHVERNLKVGEYLAKCEQLLSQAQVDVVAPVSSPLLIDGPEEGVIFDDTVPADMQRGLTSLNTKLLDGYNIPVGATYDDHALVLSALVPQRKGEIDGGAGIPVIYIFAYDINDIQNQQDHAFIRGQLLTFEQMEQYKVYEDGRYVCYEVSDLFYSDLRDHVESMMSQRTDIYFDEQVWERVQNIREYYKERCALGEGFFYSPVYE